jgi:hypothetical protein
LVSGFENEHGAVVGIGYCFAVGFWEFIGQIFSERSGEYAVWLIYAVTLQAKVNMLDGDMKGG